MFSLSRIFKLSQIKILLSVRRLYVRLFVCPHEYMYIVHATSLDTLNLYYLHCTCSRLKRTIYTCWNVYIKFGARESRAKHTAARNIACTTTSLFTGHHKHLPVYHLHKLNMLKKLWVILFYYYIVEYVKRRWIFC